MKVLPQVISHGKHKENLPLVFYQDFFFYGFKRNPTVKAKRKFTDLLKSQEEI